MLADHSPSSRPDAIGQPSLELRPVEENPKTPSQSLATLIETEKGNPPWNSKRLSSVSDVFEWRSQEHQKQNPGKSSRTMLARSPKHSAEDTFNRSINQSTTPIDHINLIASSSPHLPPNNLSYLTSLKFANLPLAFAFQWRAASSFFWSM
jgi:hypothetical protein